MVFSLNSTAPRSADPGRGGRMLDMGPCCAIGSTDCSLWNVSVSTSTAPDCMRPLTLSSSWVTSLLGALAGFVGLVPRRNVVACRVLQGSSAADRVRERRNSLRLRHPDRRNAASHGVGGALDRGALIAHPGAQRVAGGGPWRGRWGCSHQHRGGQPSIASGGSGRGQHRDLAPRSDGVVGAVSGLIDEPICEG